MLQLLLVGFASGTWAEVDPADLVQRNYSAVGVYAGAYQRDFSEGAHERLLAMWADGRFQSLVTENITNQSGDLDIVGLIDSPMDVNALLWIMLRQKRHQPGSSRCRFRC